MSTPDISPELRLLRRAQNDWRELDEETERMATDLETSQPDPLAPLAESAKFLAEGAKLAGRREILQRLGYLATD